MRTPRLLVLLAALIAVSAGPPVDSPDDLIRLGNDAFDRGDFDAADRLYAAAAERTPDPGLVAFNRAAAAVRRGDVREAEANYLRTLDDRDAPPTRRAHALYNRGVCLLLRGNSAATFRSAVACFEQAADDAGADAALAADARHNLELAKLLWNKARAKENSHQRPNDLPPDVPELPPPPMGQPEGGMEPGAGDTGPNGGKPEPIAGAGPKGGSPRETQQKAPGAGSLPVRLDPDTPDNLSTDDAKALLRHHMNRMKKDRQDNARLTAGPERPNVRDW